MYEVPSQIPYRTQAHLFTYSLKLMELEIDTASFELYASSQEIRKLISYLGT
jgi:hypothetical protein